MRDFFNHALVRPTDRRRMIPCFDVELWHGWQSGHALCQHWPGLLRKFRIDAVATEVQWSELQRDSTSVAALVDKGDVRVCTDGCGPVPNPAER